MFSGSMEMMETMDRMRPPQQAQSLLSPASAATLYASASVG
jgi:hypothetical protein